MTSGHSIAPHFVVAAALVWIAFVRIRLLDIPLERDEGEYAYGAQLMLQGLPPYEHLYTMKLPGTHVAYTAILALFGQTQAGVHIGLLLVNAVTALLLYLLVQRLFDRWTGAVAAAAYVALSASSAVQGLAANTEHFVVLFAVAGFTVLERAMRSGHMGMLAASGVLLGISVVMKQHGIVFALLGGGVVFAAPGRPGDADRPRDRWRGLAVYFAAVSAPYAATCLTLGAAGVFSKFWFWTVEVASAYSSQVPLDKGLDKLVENGGAVLSSAPGLWVLALFGASALRWDRDARPFAGIIALAAAGSLGATSVGLFFRPHYFILVLPVVAILVGVGVRALLRLAAGRDTRWPLGAAAALLLGVAFQTVSASADYWYSMTPKEASEYTYGKNPFPESVEIARLIQNDTSPDDRIAVLGSEPQIYFYSQRRAATGFIYAYPLVEIHPHAEAFQRQLIERLDANSPSYLVWVDMPSSWLMKRGAPRLIFDWYANARRTKYALAARVEIFEDGAAYLTGEELQTPRRSPLAIEISRNVEARESHRPARDGDSEDAS